MGLKGISILKDLRSFKGLMSLKGISALKDLGSLKGLNTLKGISTLKDLMSLKQLSVRVSHHTGQGLTTIPFRATGGRKSDFGICRGQGGKGSMKPHCIFAPTSASEGFT